MYNYLLKFKKGGFSLSNVKVSVIVPIYNTEKYLNKCVDSLVNQTLEDIEIILINDGSTDRSGEIADYYSQKEVRVKCIHKENSGVSNSRNLGIKFAKGQYVAFVDSDDWCDSNMLEGLYNHAISNNADVVIAGYVKELIHEERSITVAADKCMICRTKQEIAEAIVYLEKKELIRAC